MAVVQPDYQSAPRGRTDAARHREKVKEAIRRNLPDIISEESIITRKEGQVVRVPIRGVRSYRFRHGRTGGLGGGVGSGESRRGKVIGKRPKPDSARPGTAGDQPGVDYLETEIELEELIEMMLDDLGLPNLQEKEVKAAAVPRGWTYKGIEKHGVRSRLDKKRSIKEAIKRTEVCVAQLMRESGKPEAECRQALDAASGDLRRAVGILKGTVDPAEEGGSSLHLESADLRFRTLTEDIEYESNAVVLAMMDVSASMDTMKKYLARSFFFWMTSFLKTVYRNVDIRFIAHTTEARLVNEHDFFHKGESGGTLCHSAYDLAVELIQTEYPPRRWNVYPFHFSDGEDWDPDRTVSSLKTVLEAGISAFGYGEIQNEYSTSVLMGAFRDAFGLQEASEDGFSHCEGRWKQSPLLGVVLRSREDLYPALRLLLKPDGVRP